MPADLSHLYDEFRWRLAQQHADDGPDAARLRLAGVRIVDLPYRTPSYLQPGSQKVATADDWFNGACPYRWCTALPIARTLASIDVDRPRHRVVPWVTCVPATLAR